jgi:hypothetical protein
MPWTSEPHPFTSRKHDSATLITVALARKVTQYNVLAALLVARSNTVDLQRFQQRAQVIRMKHPGEALIEYLRICAIEANGLVPRILRKNLLQGPVFKLDVSMLPGSQPSGSGPCDVFQVSYLCPIVGNFDLLARREVNEGSRRGVISSDLDGTVENGDAGASLAGIEASLTAVDVKARPQNSDLNVAHFDSERSIPVGDDLKKGFAGFKVHSALFTGYHRAHVRVGIQVDRAAVRKGNQFVVAKWCTIGESDNRLCAS